MNQTVISKQDVLASVIHDNYLTLVVLNRMNIKLGFGNQSVEDVAQQHGINPDALVLILNLFNNEIYFLSIDKKYEYLPDTLLYLKNSHAFFLGGKIPLIQNNIQQLVLMLHDTNAKMIEYFYNKYIEEVTEHMDYENNTVFPYIETMHQALLSNQNLDILEKEFNIEIYGEHHDDIEDALADLKNILIRHLPEKNDGELRITILQQLFELEFDLYSHTRIENEVLIPLTKSLEDKLQALL